MIGRSITLALAVIAANGIVAQKTAAAVMSRSTQPLPQHQVRPSATPPALAWHAVPRGPHIFFGQITAIRGSFIVVQLRSGREQAINAASAIAHGDYSAPLFIGKFVSVDGRLVNGTFVAAHIYRQHSLDLLPNDQ